MFKKNNIVCLILVISAKAFGDYGNIEQTTSAANAMIREMDQRKNVDQSNLVDLNHQSERLTEDLNQYSRTTNASQGQDLKKYATQILKAMNKASQELENDKGKSIEMLQTINSTTDRLDGMKKQFSQLKTLGRDFFVFRGLSKQVVRDLAQSYRSSKEIAKYLDQASASSILAMKSMMNLYSAYYRLKDDSFKNCLLSLPVSRWVISGQNSSSGISNVEAIDSSLNCLVRSFENVNKLTNAVEVSKLVNSIDEQVAGLKDQAQLEAFYDAYYQSVVKELSISESMYNDLNVMKDSYVAIGKRVSEILNAQIELSFKIQQERYKLFGSGIPMDEKAF